MMREARLYTRENDGLVRCTLCSHGCVIAAGRRGLCAVRENRKGTLYALTYGQVAAEALDPIEKKPLYHFLPGSGTWSIAAPGCNFRCRHCQNHRLSQVAATEAPSGRPRSPQEVVAMARAAGCRSISYTYSEPTVFFEFMEDCACLAREAGLANVLVSNGFLGKEAAKRAGQWLDAANIDIKAFTDDFYRKICGARLAPVLETVARLHGLGVWLEITTLIIPGLNDSAEELRALARFIAGISPDIPWHLSAFHPAYQLMDVPRTPVATLLRARDIGQRAGLRYVYLGNVQIPGAGDTLCPRCGALLVRRGRLNERMPTGPAETCLSCALEIPGHWTGRHRERSARL